MWFALCNCGTNCSLNNSWKGFICMRIFNTFAINRVFQHLNNEFITTCQSHCLEDLTISIVDENRRPIKFTNPICIYISIKCEEETQEFLPFQSLPPNIELKEKIQKKRKEIAERRERGLINLGKYDSTKDRENEDLKFPLKSPEQEEAELKGIRERTRKENTQRDILIKEIEDEYKQDEK